MAIINVDDAYILNETGAQVDKTTGIPFKNESLTEAEAAQARANIRAGGSNRNLLDNAYFVGGGSQLGDGVFPINQRGLSSYTSVGYGIDRWTDVGLAGTTVTLLSSGVTLTSTGGTVFRQYIPTEVIKGLLGKTVCLSVMDFSGIIYSATETLPTTMPNTAVEAITIPLNNANFSLYVGTLNAVQFYFFNSSANIGVAAVKLELGTVSTLANDTPPDFGEELRKCQRRLYIHDYAANDPISSGISANQNIYLPVAMAKGGNPTVSFTVTPYVIGGGVVDTPTSVSLVSLKDNVVCLYVPTNTPIGNNAACMYAVSATRLTVSNEL